MIQIGHNSVNFVILFVISIIVNLRYLAFTGGQRISKHNYVVGKEFSSYHYELLEILNSGFLLKDIVHIRVFYLVQQIGCSRFATSDDTFPFSCAVLFRAARYVCPLAYRSHVISK